MTKKWIFEHMGVCVVEKDVFTGLKMGPKWGIWPLGHPAQRGSKRGYLAIYPQKPPKWLKKGSFWGHFDPILTPFWASSTKIHPFWTPFWTPKYGQIWDIWVIQGKEGSNPRSGHMTI